MTLITLHVLNRTIDVLSRDPDELPPEQTIGPASPQMTDLERMMRGMWAAHGNIGNPPKLVICKSYADALIKLGVPEHLITVQKRL